jgi:hypothetical protein
MYMDLRDVLKLLKALSEPPNLRRQRLNSARPSFRVLYSAYFQCMCLTLTLETVFPFR